MIDWIMILTIMSPTLDLHTHSIRFAHEEKCNEVLSGYLTTLKVRGLSPKAVGVCVTDVVVPEKGPHPSQPKEPAEKEQAL